MNQRSSLNGENQICILLDYILYDRADKFFHMFDFLSIYISRSLYSQSFSIVFNCFSFSRDRYVDELESSLFVVFHNIISCLFALISLSVRICLSKSSIANAFFSMGVIIIIVIVTIVIYNRDAFSILDIFLRSLLTNWVGPLEEQMRFCCQF